MTPKSNKNNLILILKSAIFHNRIICLLLFAFISCAGCKAESFLAIDAAPLIFSEIGGTKVIPCSTNAAIEAVSSKPEWCAAMVNNPAFIEVHVKKNSAVGTEERSAVVNVSAGRAKTVQIEVRQTSAENSPSVENPPTKRLFEHVVVISLDGLTIQGLKNAATPVMDNLIANGAVKYGVRAVMPTVSVPNHAAMICGAGTEAIGITSNRDVADQLLQPIVKNKYGRFPGIFYVIREQLPDAEQGAIYAWTTFGQLFEDAVVNYKPPTNQDGAMYDIADDEEATRQACNYIATKKPTFLFVHLSDPDINGHSHGYTTSSEYLKSVAACDGMIGRIMESIRQAGMENNTLVMIVSDHGGIKNNHGGETVEEANVAFIYHGKGIKKNYTVQQTVYMFDVAANVAFALNLKAPYAWTGRPTLPAFEGYSEPE